MSDHAPTTVLGSDAVVRGELILTSAARVDGRVEGRIESSGHVLIGDSADCACDVSAESVIVEGKVDGDVSARGLLELRAGSRVTGAISAASISIAEGASFSGQCRIGPAAAPATPQITPMAEPAASYPPNRPAGHRAGTTPTAPVIATRPIRAPSAHAGAAPLSPEERRQHELLRDPEMARLLQQ